MSRRSQRGEVMGFEVRCPFAAPKPWHLIERLWTPRGSQIAAPNLGAHSCSAPTSVRVSVYAFLVRLTIETLDVCVLYGRVRPDMDLFTAPTSLLTAQQFCGLSQLG